MNKHINAFLKHNKEEKKYKSNYAFYQRIKNKNNHYKTIENYLTWLSTLCFKRFFFVVDVNISPDNCYCRNEKKLLFKVHEFLGNFVVKRK